MIRVEEAIFDWPGKVRMHNDVIDVIWKILNSYVASYIMTENVREL